MFSSFAEITPPKLVVCPTDISVTTSTALTELQKPRVIFQSKDGLETPHTCTHFGDRDNYNFTIGTHIIRCKAFDPVFGERAMSVCEFKITVKRKYLVYETQPSHYVGVY